MYVLEHFEQRKKILYIYLLSKFYYVNSSHPQWQLSSMSIFWSNTYRFYWRHTLYFVTIIIMAQAQKRDFKTRSYSAYPLPTWCRLMAPMNKPVPCASCKKREKFGMAFTSMAIHNHVWLWYPVCYDCHKIELSLRQANEPTF